MELAVAAALLAPGVLSSLSESSLLLWLLTLTSLPRLTLLLNCLSLVDVGLFFTVSASVPAPAPAPAPTPISCTSKLLLFELRVWISASKLLIFESRIWTFWLLLLFVSLPTLPVLLWPNLIPASTIFSVAMNFLDWLRKVIEGVARLPAPNWLLPKGVPEPDRKEAWGSTPEGRVLNRITSSKFLIDLSSSLIFSFNSALVFTNSWCSDSIPSIRLNKSFFLLNCPNVASDETFFWACANVDGPLFNKPFSRLSSSSSSDDGVSESDSWLSACWVGFLSSLSILSNTSALAEEKVFAKIPISPLISPNAVMQK